MSQNKGKTDDEGRKIPPLLKKILDVDILMTKRFVSFMLNFVPFRSLKTHCKMLEISCHGIVWIVSWLIFCWFFDNPDRYQMQVNMMIGLILDIIFVATIKAATRRRRPSFNDDPFCLGPDKFSFPSGHVSRAVFIFCFFTMLAPISYVFWPPLLAWTVSVSISRLLMYRHHILDVFGGLLLGLVEALVLAVLWVEKDTATSFMSWLADEKLDQWVS